MKQPVIRLENISKRYPNGVQAASDVSLDIRAGEILCIAGENGAGKTTLMKILFGLEQPSAGRILLDGNPVSFRSASDAFRCGIGMVQQHFTLAPGLSVTQNVTLGQPARRLGLFLDKKRDRAAVAEQIRCYGFNLDPDSPASALSVGQMQQVEILKVLLRDCRILILDEPTAVLTDDESRLLIDILLRLKQTGKTIILITHKLGQIKACSDSVAVMRSGKLMGTFSTADITEDDIARLMFPDDSKVTQASTCSCINSKGKPVLEMRGITVRKNNQTRALLENIDLTVRQGEILGICGISGNGLGVLEGVLGGFIGTFCGTYKVNGRDVTGLDTGQLRALGMAYVPAKRISMGSCPSATVTENLFSTELAQTGPLLNLRQMRKAAGALIEKYKIDAKPDEQAGNLSGGNIQKMILARELERSSPLVVFAQPTWGLDVAGRRTVHEKMLSLRAEGRAIVLISYDLDEVLELSDTIAVISAGRIQKTVANDTTVGRQNLERLMLGKTEDRL